MDPEMARQQRVEEALERDGVARPPDGAAFSIPLVTRMFKAQNVQLVPDQAISREGLRLPAPIPARSASGLSATGLSRCSPARLTVRWASFVLSLALLAIVAAIAASLLR